MESLESSFCYRFCQVIRTKVFTLFFHLDTLSLDIGKIIFIKSNFKCESAKEIEERKAEILKIASE